MLDAIYNYRWINYTRTMTRHAQLYLIRLAEATIRAAFVETSFTEEPPAELDFDAATFVTLTKNRQLRGCIGSLEATQNIVENVKKNAYAAAFEDGRFIPVQIKELDQIEIEISVLTEQVQINYHDSRDLLSQLRPLFDGLVVQHRGKSATYLPQVWDELPDKKDFLSSLCKKAGLAEDLWQDEKLDFYKYQVESFNLLNEI